MAAGVVEFMTMNLQKWRWFGYREIHSWLENYLHWPNTGRQVYRW